MRQLRGRRPDDQRVEDALRASLLANARRAPSGDGLAERVLAAVDEPPPVTPRPRRPLSGWALPAIAAASVAAVAAIAIGIGNIGTGHTAAKIHPSLSLLSRHPLETTQPAVSGTGSAAASASAPPTRGGTLHGVRVTDLSFAGRDDGWALASANCLNGAGRCTALLRTHNGTRWRPMSGAAFNVPGVPGFPGEPGRGCASPCVDQLRFANDRVGYAFGPSAFFMTTDGGRAWQRQRGGAIALETLNGNVVRVTETSGCSRLCHVRVEIADIGSSAWTVEQLPDRVPTSVGNSGLGFARGRSDVYLLSRSGSRTAPPTLYRSTDNGRSWTSVGEPCPQQHGGAGSAVAAGGAGRVAFICTDWARPRRSFVATSSDAGSTVSAQPGRLPWVTSYPIDEEFAGDPATVLAAGGPSGLAISRDGGRSWQRVAAVPRGITFVGFENTHVGRVIAQDGHSIWTTRDAGRTWTEVRFR